MFFAQFACNTFCVNPFPFPFTAVHPSFSDPLFRHRVSIPASVHVFFTCKKAYQQNIIHSCEMVLRNFGQDDYHGINQMF